MININNNKYNVISSNIKFVETNNMTYSLLVSITFVKDNNKGYITFYVDNLNENKYSYVENKTYDEIDMFEMYESNNFESNINESVIIKFSKIINNKINIDINIPEYNILYNGMFDLIY